MKKNICLLCSLLIFAVGYIVVVKQGKLKDAEDIIEKRAAAVTFEKCLEEIKQARIEKALPFSSDDIHQSGIIGQEYSFITTTLGNLEAKRSTVNPNWAAVIVEMFHELGLKKGDLIAVNCSGSFPALNIAVQCAADACGIQTFVISSFGASTHGANEPDFTYQDMEHYLYSKDMLQNCSSFYSVGGRKDLGEEMDPELVEQICQRLDSYGYQRINYSDLIENIYARYQLYKNAGRLQCFVNVGGNDVSFGDSKVIVYADGGILTNLPDKDQSTGLVQLFLRDGIPVIHLLNIKSIAAKYSLPIDPAVIPQVGEGEIYQTIHYSKYLTAFFLIVGMIPLFFCYKWHKKEKVIDYSLLTNRRKT